MINTISLTVVLAIVWLLLSGIYDVPLLYILGIVSVAIVILITRRMDVIDRESHPMHLGLRALVYGPWLLFEIMKANIDVARRVLAPTPDISPTLVRLPTRLRSDLGRVVYANSITMTPGTVSVIVDPDSVLVHSLSRDGAAALEEGTMERRVLAYMGGDER
ncbi:MAG: Na+/H+ antiporter subunit E [Rhodospirillales bacterium]